MTSSVDGIYYLVYGVLKGTLAQRLERTACPLRPSPEVGSANRGCVGQSAFASRCPSRFKSGQLHANGLDGREATGLRARQAGCAVGQRATPPAMCSGAIAPHEQRHCSGRSNTCALAGGREKMDAY